MSSRERARAPAGARRIAALTIVLAGWFGAAGELRAHEYWLDPFDATLEPGGELVAAVRNGEDFVGTPLPFDPNRMARLERFGPGGAEPIPARMGDFPAVRVTLAEPGTHLVVLDTFGKLLVYEDLARFTAFLDYHGQDGIADAHAVRDLPATDVRERYFRHVKMLVRVDGATPEARPRDAEPDPADGTAEGSSAAEVFAPRGQALELVPENDPYVDDELRLTLLADGVPLADAQIELFERTPGGEVSRTLARSDDDGRVRLDVARAGEYLVNAVRVTEADGTPSADEDESPHWQSRWASLTFEKAP